MRRAIYHHIEPDNYADYGVTKNPRHEDVSFIRGKRIGVRLPDPLVFKVNLPPKLPVPHFIASGIPIFSAVLVKTLREAGVNNFQTFSCVLRNSVARRTWTGYAAINVVGLVAAADVRRSKYDTLMAGDRSTPPLLAFTKLVLDRAKIGDRLMFRLAESPSTLLVHDRVMRALVENRPPDGWNFDATEIDAF